MTSRRLAAPPPRAPLAQAMLREAPERAKADRYTCKDINVEHQCSPPEAIHSPYYSSRRRCKTYCTNAATEASDLGALMRRTYNDNPEPQGARKWTG